MVINCDDGALVMLCIADTNGVDGADDGDDSGAERGLGKLRMVIMMIVLVMVAAHEEERNMSDGIMVWDE